MWLMFVEQWVESGNECSRFDFIFKRSWLFSCQAIRLKYNFKAKKRWNNFINTFVTALAMQIADVYAKQEDNNKGILLVLNKLSHTVDMVDNIKYP